MDETHFKTFGNGLEVKWMPVTTERIAAICYEVNRSYCQSIGDNIQLPWNKAPKWQQQSTINGVELHLNNEITPEQSHQNWLKEKVEDGWIYGPIKSAEFKTHPCVVPYSMLSQQQRSKDYIFKAIVDYFKEELKC